MRYYKGFVFTRVMTRNEIKRKNCFEQDNTRGDTTLTV